MQNARALLKTLEVCLWDSGMMDKIKFIILLHHKLFVCLFLLHTVPSILIVRFEVCSKKDISSLPLWVYQQRQREKYRLEYAVKETKGGGPGGTGGSPLGRGQGGPLWGVLFVLGPEGWEGQDPAKSWRRRADRATWPVRKGRSWAHRGSWNSLSKQLLPQSQRELVKAVIGHLTLDEKEWKLQRDTQETLPWQAGSLIQPIQWNPKGQMAQAECHRQKALFSLVVNVVSPDKKRPFLPLRGKKKKGDLE